MTGWTDWRDAPPAEYGVVGDPIGHSLSPRMHRAAFRELGWTYAYRAIRVPAAEFNPALDWLTRLGYRGLNVTQPLKEAAFAWADEIDEESRRYGALNTLCLARRRGTNTDAPGFLDVLNQLKARANSSVLLLGAGGTAQALARALIRAGFRLGIWNRTLSSAQALAASIGGQALADAAVADFEIIVNTTAAHLTGDCPLIDWRGASGVAIAIDAGYGVGPTPFMRQATDCGVPTTDGRSLLLAQGARSFEWWHETPAPREAMQAAIRRHELLG